MTPKGWHINVTVKSEPFLGDPPDADVFHAAVGRAVRLWGRLEGHLDHVLLSLTLLPEAKALGTISPREMPVSMKKKAEMWRQAFRTLVCLQPARHRAMLLMTDMMDSAQARGVLVHSLWHGFISLDPLTVEMVGWKHKGARSIRSTYKVDLPEVERHVRNFDRLNTRLLLIGLFIDSLFPPIEAPDTPRQ
jgi:hypothetical protein